VDQAFGLACQPILPPRMPPEEPLLCNPDFLVSFSGLGGHCLGAATTMADHVPIRGSCPEDQIFLGPALASGPMSPALTPSRVIHSTGLFLKPWPLSRRPRWDSPELLSHAPTPRSLGLLGPAGKLSSLIPWAVKTERTHQAKEGNLEFLDATGDGPGPLAGAL